MTEESKTDEPQLLELLKKSLWPKPEPEPAPEPEPRTRKRVAKGEPDTESE